MHNDVADGGARRGESVHCYMQLAGGDPDPAPLRRLPRQSVEARPSRRSTARCYMIFVAGYSRVPLFSGQLYHW